MQAPARLELRSSDPRARWFMGAAWVVVVIKCVVVAWAVDHWRMPFHAAWVVVPTLLFAALATLLWVAHRGAE